MEINQMEDTNKPQYVFSTSILSNLKEPKRIFQALRGLEKEQWAELAQNKFQNFISQDLWVVVNWEEAHKHGKTIVGSKWVFKKKNKPDSSTKFKSCIVSKGYMQISGVHYMEKFTPIASSTTTRIILVFNLFYSNEG